MNRIRQHYHWVVAVLAFWEMIVFGGLLNSSAIFIIPITESLAIPRGVFALTKLPYSIVGTIGTMLSGWLYQKVGYKTCMTAGLLVTAAASLLTAVSQNVAMLCITQFLLGISYSVCCIAGAVYIVKEWFIRHQGLIMGAVSMSSALGGSLMTLILTQLMESWGWRMTQVFLAVICAGTALLYVFLMKDRPEQIGLQPYGCGTQAHTDAAADSGWPGLTFREWLRRPLLHLMILATFVSCLAMYMTSSILVPYFQDLGFTPAAAAGYQSTFMLMLSGAILVTGAASDRVGARPVSIFCMVCTVLGQFLLQKTADPMLCHVAVSLCGIGLAMTVVMISLLAVSLFGSRGIDGVNSLVLAMPALATIFASPISNFVFDSRGTYGPALEAAAVISAVMIPVYLIMFVMANKERTRIG